MAGGVCLKQEYKKSLDYLKESKKFIFLIIGLFVLSSVVGFFIAPPEQLYQRMLEFIKNLVEQTKDMSHIELILFIFFNNLKTSFFGMVFGFILGIFPILACFVNGYFLGFVSRLTMKSQGFFYLWRLLPHGIFELPAVFISLGLGLKFGTFFFQKNKRDSFRDYFLNSLRVFFYIIIPLLIIAAVIEGSFIFFSR